MIGKVEMAIVAAETALRADLESDRIGESVQAGCQTAERSQVGLVKTNQMA